ncbi:MAG TPA: tetratricopeptide repeat protein [Humidesulfovibrio sp.]|uniref:tetratricopeptide repeat protein n=1 Tax=Humidesulfovibrio sp. TaxID=2910988 RepID=UPI002CFB649A|nr:tetratricopeptide repeat protein [Humidesulfovibrio sp.]HWR03670.1 tetratricopeptide repeat protein [Humidesulfovibrio sp.]
MTNSRSFLFACALVLAAQLLLTACDRGAASGPALDLAIAREAYSGGYFLEAETAYERYLQSDPQGKYRLEAWTRLVEICAGMKGDPDKAVTLLETATLEYGARPKDNWPLLFRLGELYEQQGQRKKALDAWGRCLDTAGGDTAKTVQAQMRMAIADRALGKADLAVDLLTQSIKQAPDMDTKSRAMYELAQTYGMSWNWPKAKGILEEILAAEKTPQDVRVMSTYLLADAYEAERNLPKARELLLSLKETYPNPEVIIARLGSLGQHNESPAVAQLQPGDSPPPDMEHAGSADVKRRRVSAK